MQVETIVLLFFSSVWTNFGACRSRRCFLLLIIIDSGSWEDLFHLRLGIIQIVVYSPVG